MPNHPQPLSRGAHKTPVNHRAQRASRGSRTSANNNRQRINHFAPRPPSNPPPPGYTTHARPKADTASTRSAVPGSGVRGFSFVHPTPCEAHPPIPERQRRVGPHRQPSATAPAGTNNPARPNPHAGTGRINTTKSPHLTKSAIASQSPPKSHEQTRSRSARLPPWLRTESSVLRPTSRRPTRTEQTQSVSRACARTRGFTSSPPSLHHETRITMYRCPADPAIE